MIVADVDRWKDLSPLLDELLDLAPQARALREAVARLDGSIGSDAAKAREARSLLAASA